LLGNLDQVEAEAEKETAAAEIMATSNIVFNDAINAAMALVMFRAFSEPRFSDEFRTKVSDMQTHSEDLKRMKASDKQQQGQIDEFMSFVTETTKILDDAQALAQSSDTIGGVRALTKLRSFITRANTADVLMIQGQQERHRVYEQNHN